MFLKPRDGRKLKVAAKARTTAKKNREIHYQKDWATDGARTRNSQNHNLELYH